LHLDSAYPGTEHSYSAVPGIIHTSEPSLLLSLSYQGSNSSRSLRPRRIGDRTVSRRFEPSFACCLPSTNFGTYFVPGCTSDEVPNAADVGTSWALSACYPWVSFYPLEDTSSTFRVHLRSPSPILRPCSSMNRQSSPLPCTFRLVSIQPEGTF